MTRLFYYHTLLPAFPHALQSGKTPLHVASEGGCAPVVALLMTAKAKVDAGDKVTGATISVCHSPVFTDLGCLFFCSFVSYVF